MNTLDSTIWAVDPSEEKLRPSPESLANIKNLLGGSLTHVHPIYICDDENLPLEVARQRTQDYLQSINAGPTFPPEVYRSCTHKRSEWAERVLNLAHVQKSKLILLTSHGRSTAGAFFLGSFTRELLHRAPIPILLATPNKTDRPTCDHVLFATDFSESSKKSFLSFLDFIHGTASVVTLCHVVTLAAPGTGIAQAYGAPLVIPDNLIKDQTQWAEGKMQEWIAEARRIYGDLDFKQEILNSVSSPETAVQELGQKETVGLMGLAAHTGPLETLFFGSFTQALIASQKFNLWISGPNYGGL